MEDHETLGATLVVIFAVIITVMIASIAHLGLQTTAVADAFHRELVRDGYTVMGTDWNSRPGNIISLDGQTFMHVARQYNITTVYRYGDIFVFFIQQPQNQMAIPYYTGGN